jgi:hypothetical protein
MAGPEYIDEVHHFLEGIDLNEFSLFVATPLSTRTVFESNIPPEERFTELPLDGMDDIIPAATEHVEQNSWPAEREVSGSNEKSIAKR